MAKQPTLTVTTPFGTFTRKTASPYRWAAIIEHAAHPEQGVQLYGTRKGDPELATSREYSYTYDHRTGEQRTGRSWTYRSRYHVCWSGTREGALRNAESYSQLTRILGVFPIDD